MKVGDYVSFRGVWFNEKYFGIIYSINSNTPIFKYRIKRLDLVDNNQFHFYSRAEDELTLLSEEEAVINLLKV